MQKREKMRTSYAITFEEKMFNDARNGIRYCLKMQDVFFKFYECVVRSQIVMQSSLHSSQQPSVICLQLPAPDCLATEHVRIQRSLQCLHAVAHTSWQLTLFATRGVDSGDSLGFFMTTPYK